MFASQDFLIRIYKFLLVDMVIYYFFLLSIHFYLYMLLQSNEAGIDVKKDKKNWKKTKKWRRKTLENQLKQRLEKSRGANVKTGALEVYFYCLPFLGPLPSSLQRL